MAKDYGLNASGVSADVQRTDLVRFFPEDLVPMENYRFGSFDTDPEVVAARDKEIEEMVDMLLDKGQLSPIGIHSIAGKRFQVSYGDTRHQAMLRINARGITWPHGKPEDGGRARIECKVENFAKDPEKNLIGSSIVENLGRNNLTIIDLCFAVDKALRAGYTDAEIMQKCRQTDPAFMPNMRRLAVLPDHFKRQIHLKQMAASVGYLLAEIPATEHEAVLADAAAAAASEEEPIIAEEPPPIVADPLDSIGKTFNTSATDAPAIPVSERLQQLRQGAAKAKKPGKAPKKKVITARAVAEAARKRGLLAHKKIAWTIAGQREFWHPMIGERKGSLLAKLAEATVARIDGESDNDRYYKEILSILKDVE